jgi:hypothetical protein
VLRTGNEWKASSSDGFGLCFLLFDFFNVVIVYFIHDFLFVGDLKWSGFFNLREFLVYGFLQQGKRDRLIF